MIPATAGPLSRTEATARYRHKPAQLDSLRFPYEDFDCDLVPVFQIVRVPEFSLGHNFDNPFRNTGTNPPEYPTFNQIGEFRALQLA